MSFRHDGKRMHQWVQWKDQNEALIQAAGLPRDVVASEEEFSYLLIHGYNKGGWWNQEPWFEVSMLTTVQRERLRELIEKFVPAFMPPYPVGVPLPLDWLWTLDRRKTLQLLEADDWGEPTVKSHLVTTCHRLRRKPLNEFSVEDLRIMIGQQISLPHLIPLALERLEQDPFSEGDYYPGDLLVAVLDVAKDFWNRNPDTAKRLQLIAERAKELLPLNESDGESPVREALERIR